MYIKLQHFIKKKKKTDIIWLIIPLTCAPWIVEIDKSELKKKKKKKKRKKNKNDKEAH